MDDRIEKALAYHRKHKGKLRVSAIREITDFQDLNLAYTPGVAHPCLEISKDPNKVFEYTMKSRLVAIVTDGSAVLGLGNIGPLAALPVMEGKAVLLHQFGGIEAVPICLDTQDPVKIIEAIEAIAPTFAAIMLEDIKAPECVLIEETLQSRLPIPVFHDDQHGTAIVVCAALINAAKCLKRSLSDLRVVLCGTGAAGSATARLLHAFGVHSIHAYQKEGVVSQTKIKQYDVVLQALINEKIIVSPPDTVQSLSDLLKEKDVFIGVSAGNLLTPEMLEGMNPDNIVFALANPIPEIMPELAQSKGVAIVGTGRSDYPNQINNVLVFPGLMKGTLAARAMKITVSMKKAAAIALASLVSDLELTPYYILPSVFDSRVCDVVADAVRKVV